MAEVGAKVEVTENLSVSLGWAFGLVSPDFLDFLHNELPSFNLTTNILGPIAFYLLSF